MRKKLIFGTMIMTLVFSSLIMEPTTLRAKTNTVKAVRNYKVLESEDKETDKQAEKACEKIPKINLGKTTVKVGKVGKKTKKCKNFMQDCDNQIIGNAKYGYASFVKFVAPKTGHYKFQYSNLNMGDKTAVYTVLPEMFKVYRSKDEGTLCFWTENDTFDLNGGNAKTAEGLDYGYYKYNGKNMREIVTDNYSRIFNNYVEKTWGPHYEKLCIEESEGSEDAKTIAAYVKDGKKQKLKDLRQAIDGDYVYIVKNNISNSENVRISGYHNPSVGTYMTVKKMKKGDEFIIGLSNANMISWGINDTLSDKKAGLDASRISVKDSYSLDITVKKID